MGMKRISSNLTASRVLVRSCLPIILCSAVLVPSSAAFAQNPTAAGYAETNLLPNVAEAAAVQSGPGADAGRGARDTSRATNRYVSLAASDSGNTLPFTGANAVLMALAALALLSVGLVLRRSTRSGLG
ncbi:MAG: hypothetical protein WKF96_04070 [Solirubrobacteraceae bacterium]